MDRIEVPPSEGRPVRVPAGGRIRVTTPRGAQAADFFAFNADNVGEWLSPMHSWVKTRHLKPRQGDVFLSRFRRPLLDFVQDRADGVHDMLLAACDQFRYEQFGFEGHHPSCSENLLISMRRLGHEIPVVPQPINFFTNTAVDDEGTISSPPNPVPPGAYIELEAHIDLICVVSSCPFDLKLEDWPINAAAGPSELLIEIR